MSRSDAFTPDQGGRSFYIRPPSKGWRAWAEPGKDPRYFLVVVRSPSGKEYKREFYHTAAHKKSVQAFLDKCVAKEEAG